MLINSCHELHPGNPNDLASALLTTTCGLSDGRVLLTAITQLT